ncbi:translational GTPase TypA [Verrucomicrobiaceae bacterium R5-34]|uniref:Large ribosomal subunit assembly factor BipA n=1 Tax=Oceaniferula flava TaxID=2800421 RepID=A0AAE2SEG5_9BACT|nr:translational GTPase TypA [Oceaniferula flavus]MBK1832152.1 translational GTPase TypA [Verrucomicrobiaceae bacterium R5-34]MBK1856264.1 translational GTPase TypA [Oceaniferula flavus]MBM1137571.1 translational GTPase TypA [Oceaniferula flavus]
MTNNIRNIAIIAHVDHGKTTLVDELLKAGGAYGEHQQAGERAMDSMDLEREKGITIKAKNTSVKWNDYTVNIVDTPGHADFGGEVERVMKMVDGVLLLVDAHDGPQAQTRFVLRKALQQGLTPIVVVNKIDRDHSDPEGVHDRVLELFLELEASEEQFEAPFVYGSAKNGFFVKSLDDEQKDVTPLLETIIEHVQAPDSDPDAAFKMLASNIDWDDYVGRVAMGKVQSGSVKKGDSIFRICKDGSKVRGKVTKVFEYSSLSNQESAEGVAGNIVGVAGFEDIDIGDTLSADAEVEALPFVAIDPPTVKMQFSINDGPYGGREGKHVTSRAIKDRLDRELKTNVSIEVEDTDKAGVFEVAARGAMQISVLVETMRREGYEVLVSRPMVITRKSESGELEEPFESLFVEVPEEYTGGVMKSLANRRARIEDMGTNAHGATIEATISTRGLIGFEFELLNLTSGHGVMSHLFKEYAPHCGEITTRNTGTLVSMSTGTAMAYSLLPLEERGKLFVAPGDEVYEGQIIGENPRKDDLPVNPVKAKSLTNHRSATKGITVGLAPPIKMSLERAIEYIEADELLEATPSHLRLRKRILDPHERKRAEKARKAEAGL